MPKIILHDGNSENNISKEAAKNLKLLTEKHPTHHEVALFQVGNHALLLTS